MSVAVLTDGPLIRLRHLLPQGEKAATADSRFHGLLPLWEKVPEGRMRGRAVGTEVRHDPSSSTQVSLVPPPCEELTTSEPFLRATRVRPPGVMRTSSPTRT